MTRKESLDSSFKKTDKIVMLDTHSIVKRMELIIIGDEEGGIPGMVQIQKQHGKDISEIKEWKTKLGAYAAVLGVILTAVWGLILALLKFL